MERLKRSYVRQYGHHRWFIVALATIALLTIIGLTYYHFFRPRPQATTVKTNVTTTKSGAYVNQSPATPAEQQAAHDNKSTVTPLPAPVKNNPTKQTVSLFITSSDPSSVQAYIQGVIEDGGKCTATYSSGTALRSGTSTAISNVSDTVCPAINVTGVGSGNWNLTYTYESTNYYGSVTKSVQL